MGLSADAVVAAPANTVREHGAVWFPNVTNHVSEGDLFYDKTRTINLRVEGGTRVDR